MFVSIKSLNSIEKCGPSLNLQLNYNYILCEKYPGNIQTTHDYWTKGVIISGHHCRYRSVVESYLPTGSLV